MSDTAKRRTIFWARLVGWLGVGCATPVTTFAVKFGLFTQQQVVSDEIGNVVVKHSYALNGWGIVGCLLIGTYIVRILKEIAAANNGYSMTKQCYTGVLQTMPYIIALGVCYFLNGVLTQVIFCLTVLITCKLAATPLNPLPKWRFEKTGCESYSDILNSIVDAIKDLKKEE